MKHKWVLKKQDGGFLPRDCAGGFKFNGRFWMNNGYKVGGGEIRDLLCSSDAHSWVMVNPSTPYLCYAAACPVDEWIYIFDGMMRRTKNGTSFENVSSSNEPIFEPEAPMFYQGGKIRILMSDMISSFDILTGEFTNTPHPFEKTSFSARIIFEDRIFIIGGATDGANFPAENSSAYPLMTSSNKVYSTFDPDNPNSWESYEAPFCQRLWPGIHVHTDGFLYIAGGYDNFSASNFSDTWRTKNGRDWVRVETPSGSFTARHAPTLYSWNGRLIMVAGNTNTGTSVQKDVWELIPE